VASTSRMGLGSSLGRQLSKALLPTPSLLSSKSQSVGRIVARGINLHDYYNGASAYSILSDRRFSGTARYATSAYTQAQPNAASMGNIKSTEKSSKSESKQEEVPEPDPDQPPEKASIRERLRFLSRRYGWWALAVYLLASLVDFSLVFAAIHMLGADHIRDLEDRFRKYIGVGKRELPDEEVAAWPVPIGAGITEAMKGRVIEGEAVNNEEAARLAAKRVRKQQDVVPNSTESSKSSKSSGGSGTLWTEAALAYTIHKTLLLPFRVGVTAAITPSFVKYMVKLGWAKDNASVQKAAHKVRMAKDAAAAAKARSAIKA
jgi:hypothetical protein